MERSFDAEWICDGDHRPRHHELLSERPMLNYNHLYYFHLAAMEGSVAAAAERLGVKQPTVSEQLKALERTLGVSLFERTTAGLKLTEAGRLAFEHTSVMFRAGERLVKSLGQEDGAVLKAIRVGISGSVARCTSIALLMPLLTLDDYIPSIRSGDMVDLLRLLRTSDLDLVLCESEPPSAMIQGLASTMVEQTVLVAVAPQSVQPDADWQNVGLVQFRATSSYRWDVEAYLESNKLRPRIAAESDDCIFLIEAAVRGELVAVVPRSVAREAISSGRVRALAVIEPSHGGVHALYVDGSAAEVARRAVEVLVAHVQSSPYADH